jgi:hypothetical protein
MMVDLKRTGRIVNRYLGQCQNGHFYVIDDEDIKCPDCNSVIGGVPALIGDNRTGLMGWR